VAAGERGGGLHHLKKFCKLKNWRQKSEKIYKNFFRQQKFLIFFYFFFFFEIFRIIFKDFSPLQPPITSRHWWWHNKKSTITKKALMK
jgi:hypothetical protein